LYCSSDVYLLLFSASYCLHSPISASGACYRRRGVSSTSPRCGWVAAAACCDMGWISAQRGVLISAEKDRKHVLMQKVVTLNSCSGSVCLTFQFPHITTGSFHSHRWQPTTGSLQSHQHLKECNKPSVRWKSFVILWWHFRWGGQVGYSLFFFLR